MDALINDEIVALGESLGSGGFGRVYEARVADEPAVVKLIPKDPGAHRELLLAGDLAGVPNIVPVLGVGDAGDQWAIGMRRADQSLRDFLLGIDRPLQPAEALPILIDIVRALVALESKGVVHRDLKPENVLLFEGHWCLTDFGISRYADATTATDTRKQARTRQYAAPEQWLEERATSATDVYAFGVMAFEILTGSRPFLGPDFRQQHLNEAPPSLASEVDTPLRNVIDECLYKGAQARPRCGRLLQRLEVQSAGEAPSGGAAALVQANQRLVAETRERDLRESAARSEEQRRITLLGSAKQSFKRISDNLLDVIQNSTSVEERSWPVRFGDATLSLASDFQLYNRGTARPPVGDLPFDVITYAEIAVDQSNVLGGGTGTYCGRRHSLWYCDAQEKGDYAWFETAFMQNVFVTSRQSGVGFQAADSIYPWALAPGDTRAREALQRGAAAHQVAWPFVAVRDEGLHEFVDRWLSWLAKAQSGTLQTPWQKPERFSEIEGSYRH